MMTGLDLDKPVQTRDGRLRWDKHGRSLNTYNPDHDLVNAPERHEGWINIYPRDHTRLLVAGHVYRTEQDAKRHCGDHKIACIRIEFEEGEGLE